MEKCGRLLLSLLFYCLTGFGISATIKAAVGVSSFSSLNVAVSTVCGVSVGMVTMLVNLLFLLVYVILTRGKHPLKYLAIALAVVCLGWVIDFFTYHVLDSVTVESYAQRLMLFVAGTLTGGVSTGMVLNLQVLAFPIEITCAELARRTGLPFSRWRYGVDILSVSGSLLLSMAFRLPLFVREGTVISLLLLTMAISATKKVYERLRMRRSL